MSPWGILTGTADMMSADMGNLEYLMKEKDDKYKFQLKQLLIADYLFRLFYELQPELNLSRSDRCKG